MKRTLLAVLACALVGCSGAPVAELSQPIVNGTIDNDDTGVVVLATDTFLCSAEIISPHVVLSAAHCTNAPAGTPYKVYVGTEFRMPDQVLPVLETHADPLFDESNLTGGHDIGVAILKDATTLPPMAYNRSALPPAYKGKAARLIGYGLSSPSDQTSYGERRQTSMSLTDLSDDLMTYYNGFNTTCHGDSGGPAMMHVAGAEMIVSVTSYGSGDRANGCLATVGINETRVDTYKDFVEQYVNMYDPLPATLGQTGDACTTNRDCASQICGQAPDGRRLCTVSCDPSSAGSCPAGLECTDVDDLSFCMPPPPKKSGCAVGGSGSPRDLLPFALLLLALGAARQKFKNARSAGRP